MTGQTIQSMAGAPIPAVYDLLHQSQAVEESPTSAPLDAAPSAHSPTTLAPLSDENLQRQALAPKERVRRSVKMRDTERWAIQTATTSRQASSPGGSHSEGVHVSEVEVQSGTSRSAPASPAELAALNVATCEASPVISNHPSEPRQTLTVLPVPHARAVPVLESGVGSLIASEVASVNDWLSENTTNVGLNQSSRNIPMPSFSPTDVQVVGLTPTSAERMSFSPRGRFFIQPGTLIGSDRAENDSNDLKGTIVDQVSSFSTFTPNQQSSPKIEELHGTPTGRSISNLSDPLIRARLSLQEAFSTTPQARASSSSSKSLTSSPARTTSRTVLEPPAYSDHDSEDDSGLSEIKEDRTAELAAEHSWKLRRDRLAAAINKELRSPIESNVTSIAGERADEVSTPTPRVLDLPRVAQTSPAASHSSPVLATDAKPSPNYSSGIQPLANPQFHPHTDSVAISPQEPELSTGSLHEISSVNESTGISDTTGNVFGADRRKDDIISPQLAQKASSFSKKEQPSRVLSDSEPVANRQQVLPLSVRAGPLHKPNPPLSIPANARRQLPSDLLSRLEMEEWRDQTGVDDRHGLFLRASGSNCEVESRVIGLGGEERRGMKDRWGNSWGLESHVLSPLSEHTERSLTTAASCISLSTLQSVHSLRSMESPSSNSLAQRLNQAELNSARMAKLGSGIARASMLRSASSPTGSPGSLSKINDNSHQQYLETTDPHVLLEEKMKRKEARRIKREKREKRRVEELKRCESLAEKQERRRKERKKKEEFLERKQILLQKLQEDPENPTFVRDLGILYLSCNAGAAGLKIAIKHLETSLQMCDSDPVAWSSLGKAWAQLHDMPDEELAKLGDRQDTDRKQQAHNATIGLRKAILNSRSTAEALKFKVEWARYLEKSGRWRDSLGVIGEVIGNEGKMDPHCWASLGFIGLRVVFGWEPLKTLETDVLRQGILDDQASENNSDRHRFQDLCDSDRLKLLVQVRHAFERALELLMGEIDLSPECAAQRQETQKYRDHYLNQLQKVKKTEEEMRKQQSFVTETVGSGEVCHQGNGDDSKLINSHSFTEAISTSAVTNFHSDESKVEDESKPVLSELTGSASRLDKKSNISAKHQSSESRREDLSMTISEGDLLKQIADPEPTQYNRRGISMASLDENSTQEQEEKNVAKPLTIQSGPIEDFRSHAQSPVPQSNRSLLLSQLPQDSLPTKNTSQYDDVDTTNEFTDERMVEISRVPTGLNQHFSHHQQPSSDVRQEHSLSCPLPVFDRPSSVADFSQIHREVHQATADSMAGNLSPQQIFRAACYTSAPPDSASGESVEAACTDQREYFTPNSASALPPSSSALMLVPLSVDPALVNLCHPY
ncbi:hypothetical protein BY996DRAFT_692165 [Phakopsora pachyrhizi]|nr:hypothetical protein BY996DRAFT_692165 [Phakopsora pachyrhizi]